MRTLIKGSGEDGGIGHDTDIMRSTMGTGGSIGSIDLPVGEVSI